jgi:SAM-dependent methyltransferase
MPVLEMLGRLRSGLRLMKGSEFRIAPRRCPFCGPTLIVRLREDEVGVRCVRCAASAIHLTMGIALREIAPHLRSVDVCEFSASGPLVQYLRRTARTVALSEYFENIAGGAMRNGVRCEDMQKLTYDDASFDLITHTEVLEHVPNDAAAFAELYRVLRPGGTMLFTVPLHGGEQTVERARRHGETVEHLLPPVFHSDPLRSSEGILAYRDYGRDILVRLERSGFRDVRLHRPVVNIPWIARREVIVARRGEAKENNV